MQQTNRDSRDFFSLCSRIYAACGASCPSQQAHAGRPQHCVAHAIGQIQSSLTCQALGYKQLAMPQAVDAFIFYIFQYTVTNLNVFLILLAYGYVLNINNKSIFNSFYQFNLSKQKRSGNPSEQSYGSQYALGSITKNVLTENNKTLSSLAFLARSEYSLREGARALILYDLSYINTL